MNDSKVRLYVKSLKKVTGTKRFERRTFVKKLGDRPDRVELEGKIMKGTFMLKAYQTETEPQYEFVLSDEQQKVVNRVREVASEHGLEVEVIDVTRENLLHRAIQEGLGRIGTFPTLVAGSGGKIEGKMTKKQIESVLSRIQQN